MISTFIKKSLNWVFMGRVTKVPLNFNATVTLFHTPAC